MRSARVVAERRQLRLELTGDARLARWGLAHLLGDGEFRRAFGRRPVMPDGVRAASRAAALLELAEADLQVLESRASPG